MGKSEYEDYPNESSEMESLSDDVDDDNNNDDEEGELADDADKDSDETLVRRRRRLERMLEARQLSKQLFDYEDEDEEEANLHSYYDDDLFGDYSQDENNDADKSASNK